MAYFYKFSKYEITFFRNLPGETYWNFSEADINIVTSIVFRIQWVSAAPSVCLFFCNLLNVKAHCDLWEKWTSSTSKQTCLNVKTLTCEFSVCHPNLVTHSFRVDVRLYQKTTAMVVSTVTETTRWPGRSSSTTPLCSWSTYIVLLVPLKHITIYTVYQ